MRTQMIAAALCAGLLTACATPGQQQRSATASSARPAVAVADEMLIFADRLATAEAEELTAMGPELRAQAEQEAGISARLRYAHWLATPGHPGFAPAEAEGRLEALLAQASARLDDATRALVRLRLRHLRRGMRWRERHRELNAESERLREQIRELTDLERRMESTR